MAIREDLVASAVQFLRDPNVVSSSVENQIAFLRSKNLTQEEIDAALARAGSASASISDPQGQASVAAFSPAAPAQYYQTYASPSSWQQPPPQIPKRDWRDWFIMGTMMGGLGYGCYTLAKRYVYPMIAPPTPERLEEDKKVVDEQFQKVFALIDQLARDTEALKEADRERTARLDAALSELEAVTKDLRISNREHDVDGRRIREDVQSLKDAIPKAMESQKEITDRRLADVNKEVVGLKTLVSSMNGPAAAGAGSSHIRPTGGNAGSTSPNQPKPSVDGGAEKANPVVLGSNTASGRSNPFTSGPHTARPSIPAWQLAMAQKGSSDGDGGDGGAQDQQGRPPS